MTDSIKTILIILFMQFLDLQVELAFLAVYVEFGNVKVSDCSEEWPWNLGKRVEEALIDNEKGRAR